MQIQSRVLIATCIALLSVSCRTDSAPTDPIDPAVYGVVLDSLFGMRTISARPAIVLDDSTERFPRDAIVPEFWAVFDSLAAPDRSVARNFESAVQTRIALSPIEAQLRSASRIPFEFANATVYQQLHRVADSLARGQPGALSAALKGYWHGFRERYSTASGVVALSAIGYSQNGLIALVNVEYGCGGLCGEGRVVMLRREGAGWRIVKIKTTTVS